MTASQDETSPVIDAVIVSAVELVNVSRVHKIDPETIDSTTLYGENGVFDSMGLVQFLALVEQTLFEHQGLQISLMSERAMSQRRSPFSTISSLKRFMSQEMRLGAE